MKDCTGSANPVGDFQIPRVPELLPVQAADLLGLLLLEDLPFCLEPVLQVVARLIPSSFVKDVGALRDPSL